jgi:AcrR family transcriptional regulator
VSRRLAPDQRREAIVDAALAVARRQGLGATTVRDVAAEMGTSSGLIHHYFGSMDEVLAAAFERAAGDDLAMAERAVAAATDDPAGALRAFFGTYAPRDADPVFSLWLDAWSEAPRRPAVQAVSRRLNLGWQDLLRRTIVSGVERGVFRCAEPSATAWRLLSLVDGLALQVVAHGTTVRREDVQAWTLAAAEHELGLSAGSLRVESRPRGQRRGRLAADRRR